MKFYINHGALTDALSSLLITTIVRGNQTILGCVEITALTEGAVVLHTTSLDATTVVRVSLCNIEANGRALVAADLLARVLGQIPDTEVEIELTREGLVVSGTRQRFVLQVMPEGERLPEPPEDNAGRTMTVKASKMLRALRRTTFIIAENAERFAFQGIGLLPGKPARLAGARAHGMMIDSLDADLADGPIAIVPKPAEKAITAALKAAGDDEATVTVSERFVTVRCRDIRYTTSLIEGVYPDVMSFLPPDGDMQGTVSPDSLYQAVNAATIFSAEKSRVELSFDNKEIEVSATDSTRGQGTARTTCGIAGKIKFGVDPAYLMPYLRTADVDQIKLSLSPEMKPAIFRDEERIGVICLINLDKAEKK